MVAGRLSEVVCTDLVTHSGAGDVAFQTRIGVLHDQLVRLFGG